MAKKNDVKPTKLQKRTLKILKENPDMDVGKAMVKAGYSKKSAINPKENFVDRRGTQVALKQWKDKLNGRGINEDKLADKYKEWLDAQKVVSARVTGVDANEKTDDFIEVPDYKTQLKVGEWLRDEFGNKPESGNNLTQINITLPDWTK